MTRISVMMKVEETRHNMEGRGEVFLFFLPAGYEYLYKYLYFLYIYMYVFEFLIKVCICKRFQIDSSLHLNLIRPQRCQT